MDKERKDHRDRLVALSFVSVLLMLIYGPAAPLFAAADRFVYDFVAGTVPNDPLQDAVIVSVNPAKKSRNQVLGELGRVVQAVKAEQPKRIVMPSLPELQENEDMPGWAATLGQGADVYVPSDHRFADMTPKSGVFDLRADEDDILRRSTLWFLRGGVMVPSLPLAIALDDERYTADPRVSATDSTIYFSNYEPVARLSADAALRPGANNSIFQGKTVFVDADPEIVGAVATLPSGQFVTRSEATAALLANIEEHTAIVAPTWVRALELLIPSLLAIAVILYLPGNKRSKILVFCATAIVAILVVEFLFLAVGRVRIDLGRPVFILLGGAALSWYLHGGNKKASIAAMERGAKFLSAGRLEPAFAEFRRCQPSETLHNVMYKLSLAFEEQAKPERAEAVLDWMKRTQSGQNTTKLIAEGNKGTPQRLGRYVIERKIGHGAMGAVYLARDPRINRPVALKVIPIEKEFEDEELEEARLRFFREAESAGRLTHPDIITVYDAGEDKHLAYIAMEYVSGVPLTTFTDPKKLLAPAKALTLCARTADALDYAHNQQVIHRDIKPANILYALREDMLKISDFGVARLTDNNRTKTGIVLGTPMYMSPEQLNAEQLTGQSDLFSLGVTLYELIVGEVPFKATNIAALMTKITHEDAEPVSRRRAGVPPSVDAVLAKAMAKRPQDRYASGAEMATALRNCAQYASV